MALETPNVSDLGDDPGVVDRANALDRLAGVGDRLD